MRLKYFFVLTALLALLAGVSSQSFAQNELVVEWDDGSGNVVQDALYNAVMGDTAADGSRLNLDRIYVLKAGGFYWNNKTITANFPLRLVGQTPTDALAPAVVQMVLDISTSAAPGKMISSSDDMTLRNLFIIGSDDVGTQTYYQPIEVNAVGKRYIIDNCVFERSNFSMMAWSGGRDNDIFITNCKFRNMIESPSTQQWAGRGVSVWTDADTVVIENNTFFNINFTAIQIENGQARYLRFNHNTLVNIGRALSTTTNTWWKEAYFSNLLLVNVYWHGDGASELNPLFAPGRDPRAFYTGLFPVITMPSRYGTNIGRRILFSNTAAFLDPYFASHYGDTVRVQPYINAVTDSFFTTYSPANGGQMVIRDTAWLNAYPNFDNNPNDAAQIEAMYNHITASRAYQYYGAQDQAQPYFWGLDPNDPYVVPAWPLPEDFHYTDNLTGTDGLPLGDLNWFPDAKSSFESNKDNFVRQIESLPGARVVEEVAWEEQAEAGTLGGSSEIDPFTGDAWYTLVGGSSIEWSFESSVAGPVDMVIKASISNSTRGEGTNIGTNLFLNGDGNEIHDALGWGEFVFWGDAAQPTNLWSGKNDGGFHEVRYTPADVHTGGGGEVPLELVAGTNTVKFEYQWNSVSIARIDFYEPGTQNLIASLTPANAVNHAATPGGEGTWIPQGFNSVNFGTNGTVAFTVNAESAGDYKLRLFYKNDATSQSGSVSVDGAQVSSLTFDALAAGTGLDVISDLFTMGEGNHTITISGAGVNLDWVQLIQQRLVSSVKNRPGLPEGFNLAQNYPNPFNPTTNIDFDLGRQASVSLTIYNILGEKVATLINNTEMNAGRYTYQFDARNLATGVYFYSLEAGEYKIQKKMLLLK